MGLFENIRYFVASSIPPHRQEQVEYALSKNGATKADSIPDATHVISDSPWLEGVDELENVKGGNEKNPNVPVVVSDVWVDRTLILGKIQPPQYYSVDPAMLFSGVVACAAELQAHDLEVLSAGISALGGQWRVALTNDVTHLFCVSPSSTKYAVALAHREGTGIKIILPHWFDDSVRLGMRGLPVEPYEWPDPPFLKDIGVDIKKLGLAGQHDEEGKEKCEEDEGRLKEKAKKNMMLTANQFTPSATNFRTPIPKDVDLLPVKRGVFDNKWILLSWTLSLYGSRREAVEMGIRRAGGVVLRYPGDHDDDLSTEGKERRRDKKEARAVKECDILITRWRNGKAYGKAFKLHKTVGTMAWLYHVQSSGLTPRPVDQLLHYPIPRKPIPNFLQHEITVTNYTGEAREYIKRIITAMGAKFTPMMTGKNTVLIAAYIHGQKTDKARAWSLPVVNHTWLEDCFIQWRHLTTSMSKYITFPCGMDFSRLLGERGVGVRGVELCDEEEMKEDEGSSDEEMYGVDAKMDEEEDEVSKDVEEDIDMISMPDTDQPGLDVMFEHVGLPTKSGSPTKQSATVISSSPKKPNSNGAADSSAMQVLSIKSRSKSVSPTKRRLIIFNDDCDEAESTNAEQLQHSEREESQVWKPNSVSQGKSSTKKVLSVVDFGNDIGGEQVEEDVNVHDTEGDPPVLKPKNELRHRLTRKASRQSAEQREKKKAEAGTSDSTAKRLIRQVNDEQQQISALGELPAAAEDAKETRAEFAASTSKQKSFRHHTQKKEKRDPRKGSLLDNKRGDARTRVKAKSTSAKEREMYSDSEGEIEGFVLEKAQDKGEKGKRKQSIKKKQVSSSSEQEESEVVERESEDEGEKRKVSRNKKLSLNNSVPVVIELPSSAKRELTKIPYCNEREEEEEVQSSKDEENQIEPELQSRLRQKLALMRSSSISIIRTNTKHINTHNSSEGSERLPAKRGAATKAGEKLKEMMPDASKYEQEAKRARKSGGWTSLWEKELEKEKGKENVVMSKKRNSDVVEDTEQEGPNRKRRKSSGMDGEVKEVIEGSENEAGAGVKGVKKWRTSMSAPKEKIYLLTTQVVLASDVVKALEKLGVIMSTKFSQCTHLIAPSLVRTEKFLCALASIPVVLQEVWAVQSAQAKQLLPVSEFLLRDTAAETKYRMKLSEALTRAKEYKGTLLRNRTFYVTMKTKVEYKLLKNVVTAHGGQLSQQTPTVRLLTGHADRHVISCPEDISIWRPLAMQGIPIFTHEFLLIGVLKQELEWDLKDFRVPGSL